MTPSLTQSIRLLLTLIVLAALVAAQQLFSLPGGSALWRALQDSLHAPWFFTVVLVLCWWFRDRTLLVRLFVVGGLALVLAVGTEYAQTFVATRSASGADLLRNLVGGVLGFVFSEAVFWRTRNPDSMNPAGRFGLQPLGLMRGGVVLLTLVLLAVFTVWQPWQEFEFRRYRDQLLPQVVDLADERSSRFLGVNDGGWMRFGIASANWPDYQGHPVLRLTFGDSEYPTLYIREVMQRWAPYSELAIDLFVLGDAPLPLTLGVRYEGSEGTSAFFESVLAAGSNQWRIPRGRLVADQATALRVRDVLIYTTAEFSGRSLLLGKVELR